MIEGKLVNIVEPPLICILESRRRCVSVNEVSGFTDTRSQVKESIAESEIRNVKSDENASVAPEGRGISSD